MKTSLCHYIKTWKKFFLNIEVNKIRRNLNNVEKVVGEFISKEGHKESVLVNMSLKYTS